MKKSKAFKTRLTPEQVGRALLQKKNPIASNGPYVKKERKTTNNQTKIINSPISDQVPAPEQSTRRYF